MQGQGNFEEALMLYEKVLLWIKVLSANYTTLALLYTELSLAHDSFGEYDKTLAYLKEIS